ncbi:MAG: sulfite exporter TauE/SafE family protein [Bacteroidota bacterium]
MELSLPLLAGVAATFILAGLIKGVIGLGLPTVGMALLGLMMVPGEAAALLVVPSLVTNLWQLAVGPGLTGLLRRLWPLLAGICLGTWAGGGLLDGLSASDAARGLGLALVLYAGLGLAQLHLRLPRRHEAWLGLPVGLATGVVTLATGVFVVPAVPYLQALDVDKDELIQGLGLSFTVSTLALAASLARAGVMSLPLMEASVLALLPAALGMVLGQWLRGRVTQQVFRRCFFAGLLAVGLHLITA